MSHKLLLADDSVTIQRVIELTFADEDVQVVVVGDGRQAIERVRAERPDIVLADIGMPERDGYEVAAFIKNDPELAQIPVLLLTGAFEPLDEGRARAAGCDGVLVKPFEPQMVINRVNELLAGRRPLARPQPAARQPAGQEPAVQPPAAPAAPGRPAIPDALEDYFDRLDQAFANIGGPPPRPPVLERPPRDVAVAREAPAPPPASRETAPSAPDAGREAAAARDTTAPRAHAPAVPAERARPEHPPGPASDSADRREPASLAALAAPRQAPADLATAFAALLAAEEGDVPLPSPAPAPPLDPAAIPDEVIDNIVHRVIARMGDESMRRAVVDTAERLVREEIDRIKRVGAGGAGF